MTTVSRRTALLLGVPAAAAAALVARPGAASADAPAAGFVLATDLGIYPESDTRGDGTANRAALVTALSNSTVWVQFAPGDYAIDNSGPDVVIGSYSGRLVMQPGARLVFTNSTSKGLVFNGGTGARLSGLTSIFTNPGTRVDAQECILFQNSTDTYLEDVQISGSAAAGLVFWQCVRPAVVGATISGTMADGLHFANCQDGRADQITTSNTGDDGVAFVNYASGPPNTGGLATNISVTNSMSRGVAVVGQSGVTVRDVTIDTTVGHGLYCAYELKWATRTPTDVLFSGAEVRHAGTTGVNCGVRIDQAGTVKITSVTVDTPGQHGVFVTGGTTTTSDVTLCNVTVTNTPGSGFNVQHSTCLLDRVTAAETNGIGLTATGCALLAYGTVTMRNTAKTHTTHRAINMDSNASVYGGGAWIYDTNNPATGYVVGAYGTQQGGLGVIADLVDSRDLVIDDPSGLSHSSPL
jgi:hypothetical protein